MDKNTKELTDQIYDTLMGNVGMSEYHTPFPLDKVNSQFVDAGRGWMYFQIGDKAYQLNVKEVPVIPEFEPE
jgi:hypothetical protein